MNKIISYMGAAVLAGVAALGLSGAALAESPPVLGINPVTRGTIVECHEDALLHWAEIGLSKATVFHVDGMDGLRPDGALRVEELKALKAEGKLTIANLSRMRSRDGLFLRANYLRAAYGLGMIGRVYWVLPFPVEPESGFKLGEYLVTIGFSEADLATLKPVPGGVAGEYGGIPLTIAGPDRLPEIKEPVILDIDASWFNEASVNRKVPVLDEMKRFFKLCRDSRIEVADAVLAYSVDGGYLPARSRWVGNAALSMLGDPGLLDAQNLPPVMSSLQKASLLASKDKYAEIASNLEKLKKHFDTDLASIHLELAYAYMGIGDFDTAFGAAKRACERDRGFCYGLLDLGTVLVKGGYPDKGKQFFAEGFLMSPEMTYNEFERGFAFADAGLYDDAERVFARNEPWPGGYAADFSLGEVALRKGDKEGALKYFTKGYDRMGKAPWVGRVTEDVLPAFADAVKLFMEVGDGEKAARMKSDARLWGPGAQ